MLRPHKLCVSRNPFYFHLSAGVCGSQAIVCGAGLLLACILSAMAGEPEFIADEPALIITSQQDWGELGINRAAHLTGKDGARLQIGSKIYERGLGHHANGHITIALEGRYATLQAEVGLQPCAGGTVLFRVLLDGSLRFESGMLHSGDAPQPLQLDVAGAEEMQLEALDAGDGISCDMANWAEARLIPAATHAHPRVAVHTVNVAPFARTVTWDPNRSFGARASRTEEFRAEDLFIETGLKPNFGGAYPLPITTRASNKVGCIGLQWLASRHPRELGLEFVRPAQAPVTNSVRVEGWFGESAWQGEWKPLAGDLRAEGSKLWFTLAPNARVTTRKIRWIVPAPNRPAEVRLTAFTRSRWAVTNLIVQAERGHGKASMAIFNGELISPSKTAGNQFQATWALSQPLHISVRYSRPSMTADPTLLQFHLPAGEVSVAVLDVLTNDCVYLPDFGLFVAREPAPVSLADYRQRIAGRKTILEEVRHMPEQTLEQAMARTHHDWQRGGPVLLSLACDNTKFVVEREGLVRFHLEPFAWSQPWQKWYDEALELRPGFGTGQSESLSRKLEGGWLPMPRLSLTNGGVRYTERVLVGPWKSTGAPTAADGQPVICLIEFTACNEQSRPARAGVTLDLQRHGKPATPAHLVAFPPAVAALLDQRRVAWIEPADAAGLKQGTAPGRFTWDRELAPGERASLRVWLPGPGVALEQAPSFSEAEDLRSRTERYWMALLEPGMQADTPNELLNNLIRSSQVRCLIAARNEAQGARVAAGIAAMSYGPLESEAHSVIRGMDFWGHDNFARCSLDYFVHRYNTNGFLTTGYTTFGTAWHLWTLGEHYQLTHDTNWLRQAAPEVARVCHWILRQTAKTKQRDPFGNPVPESGLMPPGVLADWNAFAFHFAMNAYYVAALRETGRALREIGHPDGALFVAAAEELRRNTLGAYAWTQAQSPALPLRNGTWIPHYPSQVHSPGKLAEFFPGQDAGRSWCYDVELGAHQLVPAGLLDPHCREVDRLLDHMEDVQFLADGWFDYPAASNHADSFDLGGFSKVQPYYTRNCEIYAMRDEVKPFIRSYFNTLAAMLNPEVLTFWEHFHQSGAWDKTHETGYFLHQSRTMLVQERGDELWLAPFIPTDWLKQGRRLTVRNAPTRFGHVGYQITSHLAQGYLEATIEPPRARPPRAIVIRVRHPEGLPIQSVSLDARRVAGFDPRQSTVRLRPSAHAMNLRIDWNPP